MKHIILGTAHLASTPGKCSPDGKFHEYEFSREVCKDLAPILRNAGYDTVIDIEEADLKLTQNQELKKRAQFVNDMCAEFGAQNCIYVSIHVNAAAADGKWHNATGWEAYTSPGPTKSDKLATYLYKSAERNLPGQKIRYDYSDGDEDKEANFYVLTNTKCAAVLTENFFQDNQKDIAFLQSDEGFQRIVRLHAEGILQYLEDN